MKNAKGCVVVALWVMAAWAAIIGGIIIATRRK